MVVTPKAEMMKGKARSQTRRRLVSLSGGCSIRASPRKINIES
jgi:hypothetical protein